MAKKPKNFKNAAAYKKWLAYGHMHGQFEASPGNTPIKIKGKKHMVQHMSY